MQQKRKLSPKRQRILDFIRDFLRENGLPPTVRDIQKACAMSSTSVVDYNLRVLQREGYLRRKPDVARGIELLDGADPTRRAGSLMPRIPVLGYIAAGQPLPLVDSDAWSDREPLDTIEVSPDMIGDNRRLFALRVKGSSMIDALVDDGDVVLVEPSQQASNGAMVVARLRSENETTLKRLYLEGDTVRLQPANSLMEPIYSPAENVEIQGKVVGVIRMLR